MRLAPLALAVGLAGAAPATDAQDAIEIVPLASVSYPGVLNLSCLRFSGQTER